jgi:hypothetical protein
MTDAMLLSLLKSEIAGDSAIIFELVVCLLEARDLLHTVPMRGDTRHADEPSWFMRRNDLLAGKVPMSVRLPKNDIPEIA